MAGGIPAALEENAGGGEPRQVCSRVCLHVCFCARVLWLEESLQRWKKRLMVVKHEVCVCVFALQACVLLCMHVHTRARTCV